MEIRQSVREQGRKCQACLKTGLCKWWFQFIFFWLLRPSSKSTTDLGSLSWKNPWAKPRLPGRKWRSSNRTLEINCCPDGGVWHANIRNIWPTFQTRRSQELSMQMWNWCSIFSSQFWASPTRRSIFSTQWAFGCRHLSLRVNNQVRDWRRNSFRRSWTVGEGFRSGWWRVWYCKLWSVAYCWSETWGWD